MEQKTLFNIPFWEMQTINFKKKKKDIVKLLKKYPEEKKEFQDFYTNRQINTKGLVEGFAEIIKEELTLLAEKVFKRDIGIIDCWSLSYDKNDHHSPHNHSFYRNIWYFVFRFTKRKSCYHLHTALELLDR